MIFPVSAEIDKAKEAGFSIVLSEMVKVAGEGAEPSKERRGKVEMASLLMS